MTPAEGVTEEITPGTPPPPSNGSIPSNLKENILQFPNTMNDAATGNDELRALYVSQFPDGKINSQSIGLNPKEITSISSTLLQAIEATSAQNIMIGEMPINKETIDKIFESEKGKNAISAFLTLQYNLSEEEIETRTQELKTELEALLPEDPFINHSFVTTGGIGTGVAYFGGTSGRELSPDQGIDAKLKSAHLLADGMSQKSTVAMQTKSGDIEQNGAATTGGKKEEVGLFSRKTGNYLKTSDDLKLILMASIIAEAIPFANKAAWEDSFGHNEALEAVAKKLDIPTAHLAAPDVLTAPNYKAWVAAVQVNQGGEFNAAQTPGFSEEFLNKEGSMATGVSEVSGGFLTEHVDVSTVTAAGTMEEAVKALELKGIKPENTKFLVLGGGKVTQGMLDWALNKRSEILPGESNLRPDQFVVVEPYDGPKNIIESKYPGVTVVQNTGAGYIESDKLQDADVTISNSVGKDLKPEHIKKLDAVGVTHLSGGANVKLAPDTAEEAEALMKKLGMGTTSEYMINGGGWRVCESETKMRQHYGGIVPQDPKLAIAFMQYQLRETVRMNAENIQSAQEIATEKGLSLNEASHIVIQNAVNKMNQRYTQWFNSLRTGTNKEKAKVLHGLQLEVSAAEFFEEMEAIGFPKPEKQNPTYTEDQIEQMLDEQDQIAA